jgi:ABC-2 type transport system permease protein
MRHAFRLIRSLIRASIQQEAAYRANFLVSLMHTGLNFVTGILGLVVVFEQVESVRGWTLSSTLAVLGVYLMLNALRDLFIGPSLDSLVGMYGDVWRGTLDFTLLRPVDTQFLASFRRWHLFAVLDLLLGTGVVVAAAVRLGSTLAWSHLLGFLLMLSTGAVILYAVLLAFTALVFWSPGFLFTWVFNGLFQLARYPVGVYPGRLRLILTWIVPVGVMTTVPAKALVGQLAPNLLAASLAFAALAVTGASFLFRTGLRRYASASS